MPIITLTSDLGLKDYYVASVKAAILNLCPDAVIVDISHLIPKFDILQTAFILENTFRDFPAGTIHIIGVMPDKTKEKTHVAVLFEQQYFIGADNGMFPLFLDKIPDQIVELNIKPEYDSHIFSMKDVFVKAACHLALGGKLDAIGKPKKGLLQKTGYYPVITANTIRGTVIYIDDFGNAIININENLFQQTGKGREFSISFRTGGYFINTLSRNYNDVSPGEMLALFSSKGLLEIAINTGNASELLGIKLNDVILVDWENG